MEIASYLQVYIRPYEVYLVSKRLTNEYFKQIAQTKKDRRAGHYQLYSSISGGFFGVFVCVVDADVVDLH